MKRTHSLFAIILGLAVAGPACETAGEEEFEPAAEEGIAADTGALEPGAPAGAGVVIAVDTLEGAGAYLTDGEGRALYLFTADTAGTTTCFDACAEAWPPLMAGNGTPQPRAPAVRADLFGTVQRPDGMQVTYGGHPLYYYIQDSGPGEATGQDVHGHGGEWYLVTPAGEPLHGEGEEHQGG